MLLGSRLLASWCSRPPPTTTSTSPAPPLKTPELGSFMRILTSSPPAAQLNDCDLVLTMSFAIDSTFLHLFSYASLTGFALLKATSVPLFIIVTQSSSPVLRLSVRPRLSHLPLVPLMIVKETIPFLPLWLCKFPSQLSHCLSTFLSPLCLFTLFWLLPSPLLLPLI